MFAAIKKKMNPGQDAASPRPEPVSPKLQAKLAKGISTNMRILVSGRKKSGKSSLLRRLKGLPHKVEYTETKEPVAAVSVNWNYKATTDVIKVDAWEVAEENLENYIHGSAAVILMYQASEPFELDFMIKLIPSVPRNLPILVLANFIDEKSADVDQQDVDRLKELSETRIAPVYFCKSAMTSGRGLNMIYQFFNIPYLILKEQELTLSLANTKSDLSNSFLSMQSLQQSQFRLESTSTMKSTKTEAAAQPKDLQNNLVMEEEDEISDEEMMVNSIFMNKKNGDDGASELEERKRPIGKSPEALESSSGPKDSSSPILLAPIAKDDSCDSLGETSTITLQSLPEDEESRNQPADTTSQELDWSRNNYLASESTESLEKLSINHISSQQ